MEKPDSEKLNDEPVYQDTATGYYYYGYCISLLYKINQTDGMQFEFQLLEPPDGSYGTMQDNGSWNGMINELIQDVSLGH